MKNHNLISLLKTFSKKEINDFGEFVSHPFYNKREAVRKLYDIIFKIYPSFAEPEIKKEVIFSKLYPGKKFNESSLRVMMHYLYELAKKFLTIRNFEVNTLQYRYHELSELHLRNHIVNLEKIIDQSLQELDPVKYLSDQYYFHKFRFKHEKLFYLSEIHSGVYERFLREADFEGIIENLSLYYYILSTRLYLNILNLEIIYRHEFSKKYFEEIFSGIKKSLIEKIPLLNLYYDLVMMIVSEDAEQYYFHSKKLLKKLTGKINTDDLREAYINQLNYCSRKILTGDKRFLKEKFEVCKEEIKSGTYLLNGAMSPVYYKQVVITGLMLNQNKWVDNFIRAYKNELEQSFRENTYNYCCSLSSFRKKRFEESLEYLSRISFKELYQKAEVKTMQMMIYYEMGAEEPLRFSLEAFRHFISNSKLIPEQRKPPHLNFYKCLNKILSAKSKNEKYDIEKLKSRIMLLEKVTNKEWLIEKVDELL